MFIPKLETERLLLRGWRETDLCDLAAIHGDPDVMRFLGPLEDRSGAWRSLAGLVGHWALRGYGKWAVERKSDGVLIGRVGIINPEGWPGEEVGWTLGKPYWGQGYATEASAAAMRHGFENLPVDRLISCIDKDNIASQSVARRLGETRTGNAVLHIRGEDYPVEIWSISRAEWQRRVTGA